jgi:hypothetical protein
MKTEGGRAKRDRVRVPVYLTSLSDSAFWMLLDRSLTARDRATYPLQYLTER